MEYRKDTAFQWLCFFLGYMIPALIQGDDGAMEYFADKGSRGKEQIPEQHISFPVHWDYQLFALEAGLRSLIEQTHALPERLPGWYEPRLLMGWMLRRWRCVGRSLILPTCLPCITKCRLPVRTSDTIFDGLCLGIFQPFGRSICLIWS
jgi:hypothetical protein